MRRADLGAIVGAALAVGALAAYAVADARDVVPGVLTVAETPSPSDPPDLVAQSGLTLPVAGQAAGQAGESPSSGNEGGTGSAGDAVSADAVDALWQTVASAAEDGKWTTWGMVLDASTGDVLLDARSSVAHTPASTTKVLASVSALSHLDENARLATGTSLLGTDLYLWGQGDLMLARGTGDADAVDGRAGIADLAADTAAVLTERGIEQVTLRWNHAVFDGASHLKAWDDQDSGDYEGRVGAFAIDGGRVTPGVSQGFLEDPGRDAALELAANLRNAGVEAIVQSEADVPEDAEEIARVESATVGQQVRWMLHHSDNTLADQYCRLAAASAGASTDYSGATSTVADTLTGLGVDTTGLRLQDCSGLSTGDRISARTLAQALRASMISDTPALRDLVRSLPWGGLDGTLSDRLSDGAAAANVQAKTGSLPTVSSLAGVVTTSGGRTLVFAIGNDSVPDDAAYWTRWVLDDFVQGLADL